MWFYKTSDKVSNDPWSIIKTSASDETVMMDIWAYRLFL